MADEQEINPQTIEDRIEALEQAHRNLRLQKLGHKEAIEDVDEKLMGVANQLSALREALRLTQDKDVED